MELIFDVWQWVENAAVPFSPVDPASWGQLGDWVGGVGGTFITFASLVALVFTLRLNRAAMTRQSVYALFATMSKTHDDLTASFQIYNSNGADVFRVLLSDFNVCLNATVKNYPELNVRQTIDVAYSLFFYGATISGRDYLKETYDSSKVKAILDDISLRRNRLTSLYPKAKGHRLSGNQARLSNYYRNLYGIYSFIDESKLPAREKRSILKTVRTRMSNHEQALLALNICSHLGAKWEHEKLLARYEPIKNIPKAFLSLPGGSSIEDFFPEVNFEFEQRRKSRVILLGFDLYGVFFSIKVRHAANKQVARTTAANGG
ncbi:conserved hypothetical protein [Pseudomonas sp. 8Z]|uniref:putative phage abortive infection protein n=1 Tax=Pseudomonas sp. 8Z TaxID=2653166 RepID=UPI0012F0141E|nr:putative phage abortive infection protein [Pseudomonas sp. 8Z]VXC89426.1 conserved hypothetical protein [Pseudomonas sp. 8Z]